MGCSLCAPMVPVETFDRGHISNGICVSARYSIRDSSSWERVPRPIRST